MPNGIYGTGSQPQWLNVENGESVTGNKSLRDSCKGLFETKDWNNAVATNNSEAGQIAKALLLESDMVVGGRKVISAKVFNSYVEENFPDVEFNHVNEYISLEDATGSITVYVLRQENAEKAANAGMSSLANDNPKTQISSGGNPAPESAENNE